MADTAILIKLLAGTSVIFVSKYQYGDQIKADNMGTALQNHMKI